jgi:hypothetical protein
VLQPNYFYLHNAPERGSAVITAEALLNSIALVTTLVRENEPASTMGLGVKNRFDSGSRNERALKASHAVVQSSKAVAHTILNGDSWNTVILFS